MTRSARLLARCALLPALLLLLGSLQPASATQPRAQWWYRVEIIDVAAGWPPIGFGLARCAIGLPPPYGLGVGLELADGQINPWNPGLGILALSAYYVPYAEWDALGRRQRIIYVEALGAGSPDGNYLRAGAAVDWCRRRFSPLMGFRAGIYRVHDGWKGCGARLESTHRCDSESAPGAAPESARCRSRRDAELTTGCSRPRIAGMDGRRNSVASAKCPQEERV